MRRAIWCGIGLVLVAVNGFGGTPAASQPAGDAIVKYLNETLDWYRRVQAIEQAEGTPQELLQRQAVRQDAMQALKLAFDFAKAEAAVLDASSPAPATKAASPSKKLDQAAQGAADRAQQLNADLRALDQQIAAAPTEQKALLAAQRAKLASQLNLVTIQRDVLGKYAGFVATASAGAEGVTLSQKVEDLEKTAPEVAEAEAGAAKKDVAAGDSGNQPPRPETLGVFGLFEEMFTLSGRTRDLSNLANDAMKLRQTAEGLRGPVRAQIMDAVRQGNALAAPTTSPVGVEALGAQRVQLDALAGRFKELSDVGVPLGEESVVLEAARQDLMGWRVGLRERYGRIMRALLVRLGVMAATLLVLVILSGLWRRATMKYVHDIRRRRQLMMLRRIVVTAIVVVIIVAGVVSEFGSLATFAGLITAGVAVALQTVILSGVAYFFFIGRFGVRVGDRVTISGITGDVLEVGLFRLYLTELAGKPSDLHSTGRIVVFSNAVLFQPSAFYKQLPGANYAWHEVVFSLSHDADYEAAEKRLLAAVESVFATYRDRLTRHVVHSPESLQPETPKALEPEGRLRFVDSGLEFVVRYPVDVADSSAIDDQVTRALLKAIHADARLKMVSGGTPTIQSGG